MQHCTLQAFEQLGALYINNHDDKYPARPGFKPGTSRLSRYQWAIGTGHEVNRAMKCQTDVFRLTKKLTVQTAEWRIL